MLSNENYIITWIGPDHYQVYNEEVGRLYDVITVKGRQTCTCPHWHWRVKKIGGICKHHKLIKKFGAWNEE